MARHRFLRMIVLAACFSDILALGCREALILGGPIRELSRDALTAEKHPFILLQSREITDIRLHSTREPAAGWRQQIETAAASRLTAETPESPGTRLAWARNAAMAYILSGDTRFAEHATALLASTTLFESFTETNDPIHTLVGQVPRYCEAYDLLRTVAPDVGLTWQLPSEADTTIRNNIAAMGQWLRTYRPFWYGLTSNNWAIRQYAALALCGMTISTGCDNATPEELAEWTTYGIAESLDAMQRQVCEEGAFAEGCAYMRYSAENYMPFFFACRNKLGENFFSRPAIRRTHEWLTQIRTPAGLLPNFDDSSLTTFPTHYLTSAERNPDSTSARDKEAHRLARRFAWDWQQAGSPIEDLCRAICWYDDTILPEAPTGEPSIVLPEAGTAVFRSDWTNNALYMLLIGEHGKPRINGYGHEHPDNTSFIIEAFGEQLAIDGGYIDFTNHTLVNRPENHNLILIDGEGPLFVQVGNQPLLVDQDATLQNYDVNGDLPRCTVATRYAAMDIRRTVLMPRRDHFIIIDYVKQANGPSLRPRITPPQLSWLLHGNAGVPQSQNGTDGDFHIQENTATWTRPSGVRLTLALTCSAEGLILRERTDADGSYYPHQLTGHGPDSMLRHRTAEGVVHAREAVFVAVLIPAQFAASVPQIADISTTTETGLRLTFPNGSVETIHARKPTTAEARERTFTWTRQDASSPPPMSFSAPY